MCLNSLKSNNNYTVCLAFHHQLVVGIKLPSEGEFGVALLEKVGRQGDVKVKVICNYLLSTRQQHVGYMKVG